MDIDYKTQKKREYHKRWRAEHRESVEASQLKYWAKKLEQARKEGGKNSDPAGA